MCWSDDKERWNVPQPMRAVAVLVASTAALIGAAAAQRLGIPAAIAYPYAAGLAGGFLAVWNARRGMDR